MGKTITIIIRLVIIIGLFLFSNIYGEPPKSPPSPGSPLKIQTQTLPPIDNQPLTRGVFIQIAQRATPAVVNIFNMVESGALGTQTKQGGGTGFIIDSKKGTVLTNHHVVAGAKSLLITLNDKRSLKGKLIGSDPLYDVAIVEIINPPPDLKQITLGNSDKVTVGEWVMAIGQPLFMDYTVTAGIVCALGREVGGIKGKEKTTVEYMESYIQIDALINPGNSGGPLFNLNGEVIGINTIAMGGGYGGAIPINTALVMKDKIIKDGRVIRAYTGVIGSDFNDFLALNYNTTIETLVKDLGLNSAKGVFIQGCVENSPAESVGLMESDVMVEFYGKKVDTLKDYREIIGKLSPGSEVKMKIIRKGKEEIISLTLGELGKK